MQQQYLALAVNTELSGDIARQLGPKIRSFNLLERKEKTIINKSAQVESGSSYIDRPAQKCLAKGRLSNAGRSDDMAHENGTSAALLIATNSLSLGHCYGR